MDMLIGLSNIGQKFNFQLKRLIEIQLYERIHLYLIIVLNKNLSLLQLGNHVINCRSRAVIHRTEFFPVFSIANVPSNSCKGNELQFSFCKLQIIYRRQNGIILLSSEKHIILHTFKPLYNHVSLYNYNKITNYNTFDNSLKNMYCYIIRSIL